MSKKVARDYDNFFQASIQEEDAAYFHYYVDDGRECSKIRFKVAGEEDEIVSRKTFLITHEKDNRLDTSYHSFLSPRISDADAAMNGTTDLLEKPVNKLFEEIMNDILDQKTQNMSIENPETENQQNRAETLLWTDKYMPETFTELLSDDKINRDVLTWLMTWQETVFKKKVIINTSQCTLLTTFQIDQPKRPFEAEERDGKSSENSALFFEKAELPHFRH